MAGVRGVVVVGAFCPVVAFCPLVADDDVWGTDVGEVFCAVAFGMVVVVGAGGGVGGSVAPAGTA
ncbi:MAG: hypothetical protein ACHQDC_00340, partial [Acidimicrobiales bacterium]